MYVACWHSVAWVKIVYQSLRCIETAARSIGRIITAPAFHLDTFRLILSSPRGIKTARSIRIRCVAVPRRDATHTTRSRCERAFTLLILQSVLTLLEWSTTFQSQRSKRCVCSSRHTAHGYKSWLTPMDSAARCVTPCRHRAVNKVGR